MNKKGKKIIKIIVTICIIILLIDAGVLFYSKFIYKPKKSYFDSINSFEITNKGYISVGSNNDNNKGYEKAKITKYNNEKEKTWEKLYNKGINTIPINTAIGYKELYKYFDKKISFDDAVNLIKRNSRRYAKRQYTFFKNQFKDIKWIDVNYYNFNETYNEVLEYFKES